MIFRPNTPCMIYGKEEFDVYGKPVESQGRKSKCSVVRISSAKKETSIRSDASASRGRADEQVFGSILLMLPKEEIQIDNKVEVNGFTLKVVSVMPRYNVAGRLEHQEIGLEVWV